MEILYEDDSRLVYMNPSKEIFVTNKTDKTSLRMSVNVAKGGISMATNELLVATTSYHSVSGLTFFKK